MRRGVFDGRELGVGATVAFGQSASGHEPVSARVAPAPGIRARVPWVREGSADVVPRDAGAAAAREMAITDQRLWRIIAHYVGAASERLDLDDLKAVAFDETASKRGHNYVTIFIDLDRKSRPVVFATPGQCKEAVRRFKDFLTAHNGKPGQDRRSRLRHVTCLPGCGRRDLPRGVCDGRLVPCRATVHQSPRRGAQVRGKAGRNARRRALGGPLLPPVLTGIETVEKQRDRTPRRHPQIYVKRRGA
ncbi:hypothetical protein SPHV1_760017 [Novosphingobium sp. KN65.2]|nr:hypothetical protein SPHV1_760017 [Novosphingobium sp. KN65.2]